jgi:hypothetical protein
MHDKFDKNMADIEKKHRLTAKILFKEKNTIN